VAGVLILVRLKLTLLRRSMTGSRGAWMVAVAVVGTGLAVSTIVLAALYRGRPAILGDLLGVVYALGACPQRPARGRGPGQRRQSKLPAGTGRWPGLLAGCIPAG
jgi:hypothetical protein